MACNGICHRYKVTKPHSEKGGRYNNGHKRCNTCEIFIKWEGLWRPCCGRLLRTKPRATRLKRRLLLQKKFREEN